MDKETTLQGAALAAAISGREIAADLTSASELADSLMGRYSVLILYPDQLVRVTAEVWSSLSDAIGKADSDDLEARAAARHAVTAWNTYRKGVGRAAKRAGKTVAFRKGGRVSLADAPESVKVPSLASWDDGVDEAPASHGTVVPATEGRDPIDGILALVPHLNADGVRAIRKALSARMADIQKEKEEAA